MSLGVFAVQIEALLRQEGQTNFSSRREFRVECERSFGFVQFSYDHGLPGAAKDLELGFMKCYLLSDLDLGIENSQCVKDTKRIILLSEQLYFLN